MGIHMKTIYDRRSNEELTFVRTTSGNDVEVTARNAEGDLLVTSTKVDNTIKVMDYTDPDNPVDITEELEAQLEMTDDGINNNTFDDGIRSITWGNWTSKTVTFKTLNKTAVQIISYLLTEFPNIPAFIINGLSGVFTSFSYPYATVKIRMRLGTDANYQYAQEEVTVWGRNSKTGTKYNVYGPNLWQQKKSLNRG